MLILPIGNGKKYTEEQSGRKPLMPMEETAPVAAKVDMNFWLLIISTAGASSISNKSSIAPLLFGSKKKDFHRDFGSFVITAIWLEADMAFVLTR